MLPVFLDHDPSLDPPKKPISYSEGHNPGVDLHHFAADHDIPVAMPPEGRASANVQGPSPVGNASSSTQVASPPDIKHQQLTFSIVGGDDKGDFKITSGGLLKFKKAPDFDHPKDANHDNLYKVKVSVSDGFLADEATIKVKVTQEHHHSARMPDMVARDHVTHSGSVTGTGYCTLEAIPK